MNLPEAYNLIQEFNLFNTEKKKRKQAIYDEVMKLQKEGAECTKLSDSGTCKSLYNKYNELINKADIICDKDPRSYECREADMKLRQLVILLDKCTDKSCKQIFDKIDALVKEYKTL